jgi:hypothetical protein
VGEELKREFSLTDPVDTGRRQPQPPLVTPPFLPGGQGIPGIGNQTPQPSAPILRPSFLQAFLSSLGPALAGGMAAAPGSPFGTGLAGALAGIQEQNRYNTQLGMQQQQMQYQRQQQQTTQARESALAASTIAHQQAQIDALQNKPIFEEKPIPGSEFTDEQGNRLVGIMGPNGVRTQVLGKSAEKPNTAVQDKQDYQNALGKALTAAGPGFNPATLADDNARMAFIAQSGHLTPQEKTKAIAFLQANPTPGGVTPGMRYVQGQENQRAAAARAGSSGPVSPADVALVKQIGEGRSDLPNPRTKEGQRMAALVADQYPDYDATKGATWGKTRNEYMGSGQTAKKVVSYNTALAHMADLYQHSTFAGLYEPGSKDYSDRSVALNYVSNEVGTAIKNGVMSQDEGKQILSSLKGWTPGTAKERTAETARLLHDKIDEYQRKFQEAAPSSSIQAPILMSPKAGAAYDYVQSGGQRSPNGAYAPSAGGGNAGGGQIQVTDPQGGIHTFPDQASADRFRKLAGIQ